MRKQLFRKINADLKKKSLNALSLEMGLKQPTLHRIVKGKSKGDITTWEKIEAFYRKSA
jgi:hypothetical protein